MPTILLEEGGVAAFPSAGMAIAAPAPALSFMNARRLTSELCMNLSCSFWKQPRSLLHFARGRSHSCRLPRLRINTDQRHSSNSFTKIAEHMATSSEVRLYVCGQRARHRQAAQLRVVLAERADGMLGREAGRLERLLGTHAEIHIIENHLDGCLVLHVPAGYRNRHHRLLVVKKQSRA